ncbi:hypothetical protein FF2_034504 [Malus domestica]
MFPLLGSRGREVESLEFDAAVEEEDEGVEFVAHAGSLGLEVDEGTTTTDPPFSLKALRSSDREKILSKSLSSLDHFSPYTSNLWPTGLLM